MNANEHEVEPRQMGIFSLHSPYMQRSFLIYAATNVIGLMLFAIFVEGIREGAKMEERDYYDFGDSLNFIMTAVPVFFACALYSFIWGIKALNDIFRRREYQALRLLLAVVTAWTVLLFVIRQYT